PPATSTLSLHDALPILYHGRMPAAADRDCLPPGGRNWQSPATCCPNAATNRRSASAPRRQSLDSRPDSGPPPTATGAAPQFANRSEEHTSELQSLAYLV